MPRRRKENAHPSGESESNKDAFYRQALLALENIADPRLLGETSPLAAPYVLGVRLDESARRGAGDDPLRRGEILIAVVHEAIARVDDPLLRDALDTFFLKRDKRFTIAGIATRRGMSDRTLYRLRNRALAAFVDSLHEILVPPLLLESPAKPQMVGRDDALAVLESAIREGNAIYISGASGIGKTTLAAYATVSTETERERFWFTIRPGFNDYFSSFLFSLAFFLHNRGASNTWRQVVADKGFLSSKRVLPLLRADLESLKQRCLICIDEIDQLRAEISEHSQLIGVIEELLSHSSQNITLLLLGQRTVLATPVHLQMGKFDAREIELWAAAAGIERLHAAEIARLLELSKGLPLVLAIFGALLRSGESIESLLAAYTAAPALEALLIRLIRRLTPPEFVLLKQLAVFESGAPADAFQADAEIVQVLVERELLIRTQNGLLMVAPHLRMLIHARIPAEERRLYHSRASLIAEERGATIDAMRHAFEAREEARAAMLWLERSEEEINRGHGERALEILQQIVASDMPSHELVFALKAARVRLLLMSRSSDEALEQLSELGVSGDPVADAYALELKGRALESRGDFSLASESFDEALALLNRPLEVSRSKLHFWHIRLNTHRTRDLVKARHYAIAANIEAQLFHGNVEEADGNYALANKFYASALELSRAYPPDPILMARLLLYIGRMNVTLGKRAEGIEQLKEALGFFELAGDHLGALTNQSNLVYSLTLAQRTREALEIAIQWIDRALRIGSNYDIAGLTAAGGEAAVYENRWDLAEYYLALSLQQEEEFFRGWALTALGVLRERQDRRDEAIRLFEEAVRETQQIDDVHGEAYALMPLALSLHAAGNAESALGAARRAHDIYRTLGMPMEISAANALVAMLIGAHARVH